ncbi:DNA-directed DNA polymerase [Bertholletia excelsa]
MARLATRTAKPNGQCYIPPEKVDDYLQELPVKALPGIGHVLEEKLKRRQVETCGQLRMISKESLQKDFGIKTGDMLWNFSRGHDMRLVGVIQESKSVGADVNWGVRFNHLKDCQHFITNLCKEVSLRLQGCGVQGRSFTLKVKKRRQDAKEPVKYLGCGDCENLSHSVTVPMATDDVDLIQRITTQLFGSFHIDVKDIRGMGLQVSKLESVHTAKQRHERNSIRSWLISASSSAKEQLKMSYPAKESSTTDFKKHNSVENRGQSCSESTDCSAHIATNAEAHENKDLSLPPLADLDIGVLESLPPDVISEINGMYDGKLLSFISKEKGKSIDSSNFASEAIVEGRCHLCPCPTHDDEIQMEDKEEKYSDEEILAEPVSDAAASTISSPVPDRIDLMPSSLSQIDISVLQQLPEELRIDILEQIPGHRRSKCVSDADLNPPSMPNKSLCPEYTENRTGPSKELWAGNPPEWVKNFKVSNCWVLKILADKHYKSGSTGRLSSILQCLLSESKLLTDACSDGWDDAISCFCEVLKQYIKLRIESDIEELYVCFCFLRRLTMKSTFFFQVYSATFPYLQAFVGENYGGSLHISNGND